MSPFAVLARTAAVAVSLLVSVVVAASASAAGIAGQWVGAYGYEDGRDAVYFELEVRGSGGGIAGTIVETQTFGAKSADGTLKARISGSIKGNFVTFTKTYDGTGGQTHSVTYRGTLVRDGEGSFMFGTWRLGSDVGSWFATLPSN